MVFSQRKYTDNPQHKHERLTGFKTTQVTEMIGDIYPIVIKYFFLSGDADFYMCEFDLPSRGNLDTDEKNESVLG